ncbi:uncharacterized protein K02A2.6-like [Ruditapes philippinarum]|uniref:uncharacterized protein K02A2.6-like n=1 Tax=Ruditapes philippinarum TaxID=129788 RepID=UPI00295BAF18|nr:uncharacterized protein K02A2.6-like [Ruditapes philippinarum]
MHMARYGQVETLKSDNGPQFSSEEFHKFASDWNFKHVTSSPGYSQSNGFIEKMVSIAKKSMKKCHETKTDPYLAFLEYRNTPLNCGYSPAQLLMGRRLKSILPTTNEQLKPSFINHKSVRKSLQENKVTQKNYYDKSSRSLPPLNKDDSCRVQFGKTWKPAIVLKKEGERSYKVQTEDGAIYRRNRRFINKTREKFPINTESFPNILNQGQDPHDIISNTAPLNDTGISQNNQNPISHETRSGTGYQTRSGRVVKPNKRYNTDEWSTVN